MVHTHVTKSTKISTEMMKTNQNRGYFWRERKREELGSACSILVTFYFS